jgi:hypothetical protein
MHNFKEYKEHSSGVLLSEAKQIDNPRMYLIEEVIFNKGFIGAKQTLRVLNSMKDRLSGTELVTREDTLALSENILKATRLLSDISALTLNRISASEIIKNHFKTFTKLKRNKLNDADNKNLFMKYIEQSLNAHILQSKRVDTRRKRQIEKTEILRFYRNISKEITVIFEFVSLVLEAKNQILDKLKNVKDEDAEVKIEEGFVQFQLQNKSSIVLLYTED